jgi:hypothetical protein
MSGVAIAILYDKVWKRRNAGYLFRDSICGFRPMALCLGRRVNAYVLLLIQVYYILSISSKDASAVCESKTKWYYEIRKYEDGT